MADPTPKPFRSFKDANSYAKDLAYRKSSERLVAQLKPDIWIVGTNAQIVTQMGLVPVARHGATRKMRRTPEQINEIYKYWNATGDIAGTARKFGCSKANVYGIVSKRRGRDVR